MSDTTLSSQIFSWLLFTGKTIGGLLLTLTVILYYNQEKLLYIPNPPGFPKTPNDNPPGFNSPNDWLVNGRSNRSSKNDIDPIPYEEEFVITSDNIKIHVWLLLQVEDSINKPTIIYFHGNAGNMGFRLKNAAMMYAHANVNVIMMDYRGFGSSEGNPTEHGINLDGEAVLNFAIAHPKLRNSPIILFGRSLGGAVAFSLAHRFPTRVSGIIVENTFTSVSGMVDILMPILSPLKKFILFMKWNSDEKIQELLQPILFISGDSDELVPPSHMKTLYNLATKSVHRELYSVLGGSHNDTWEIGGTLYYTRIASFINDNIMKSKISNNTSIDTNEDDDYCIVDEKGALPTMGTNFIVK